MLSSKATTPDSIGSAAQSQTTAKLQAILLTERKGQDHRSLENFEVLGSEASSNKGSRIPNFQTRFRSMT